MTDDLKKTNEKQPQNSQVEKTQVKTNPANNNQVNNNQAKTVISNTLNSANTQTNTAGGSTKADTNVTRSAEPQMKKVDISIAGTTYPINCPVHEEEELRAAVFYINDYVLNLRKNSPSLSQDSLLLLCCLNLHETVQTNKRGEEDRSQQEKQSVALLSKVIQDAHSIL